MNLVGDGKESVPVPTAYERRTNKNNDDNDDDDNDDEDDDDDGGKSPLTPQPVTFCRYATTTKANKRQKNCLA